MILESKVRKEGSSQELCDVIENDIKQGLMVKEVVRQERKIYDDLLILIKERNELRITARKTERSKIKQNCPKNDL